MDEISKSVQRRQALAALLPGPKAAMIWCREKAVAEAPNRRVRDRTMGMAEKERHHDDTRTEDDKPN